MSTPRKLRIAISGGGLAGATLANALIAHPHLTINVYESAPEFSERGAAVGITGNAQTALEEIGASARAALDNAGAVPQNSTRLMMGSGVDAGEMVFDLHNIQGVASTLVVHRAAFLRELLKPLPKEILHASKKIVKIETQDSTGVLIVHFQDGTKEEADAVIGADGIHGFVRKYILGADDPATEPVFAGWWDSRNLVTMERAKEALGEKFFEDDRQYGWCGEGGFIMHDVLDGGKTVQCIGCCWTDEKWRSDEWRRPLNREALEKNFAKWLDGPIAKGMIDLLLEQEEPRMFSQWEHKHASTYVKGRVCMMGDAAHAMTPWQGSGAGMAIEDAMILATVLGASKTPEELNAALNAYDEVRRPRTQQLVDSSTATGKIMSGKVEGVQISAQQLREALPPRWNFIMGLDIKQHKVDALAAMGKN